MVHTLEQFAEDLRQDVLAEANLVHDGAMLAEAFTELAITAMTDTGDWPDGTICYHKRRGAEISAWGWDPGIGTLNLAVTCFNGAGTAERLAKAKAEAALRRLRKFFELATGDLHLQLEESSPAFDAAYQVRRSLSSIRRLKLYLLTDMVTSLDGVDEEPFGGIDVSQHVWDLARLHRLDSSGREREQIDVDLVALAGQGLSFLESPSDDPNMKSYLLVVPGKVLADLYTEYGPQLLELNVRSFLQARGKVNKGIRQTIIDQPERVFAYNNGISATASEIQVETSPGELPRVVGITDLQIVNGGQTTASIARAHTRDGVSVENVSVQAKLTVIPSKQVAELVPMISRFANSQNKVSDADLTANHSYHVQIEKLSRTIWAPAQDGSGHRETRWFYERARGQYNDQLASERTPARKREFRLAHPMSQKFTKTDLAKFENTWHMKPHLVSRGAQKSFVEFMLMLDKNELSVPGRLHFAQLCAKALMYRSAERIVQKQGFGGYRANIVSYTLALINLRTNSQIDLEAIWRSQRIGPRLAEAIEGASYKTHTFITNPPGGQNITEWCKKEMCWKEFSQTDAQLVDLNSELVSGNEDVSSTPSSETAEVVASISSEQWAEAASWVAEHGLVPPRYGPLALGLARNRARRKTLTERQVVAAFEFLTVANENGYSLGVGP